MNSAKAVFACFYGLFFLVCVSGALEAQSPFVKGEELFVQNKPQEALPYLEQAAAGDPAHVQAYLYLGIAYLQVNRVDDAIAAYLKILPRGGTATARIAFNLGNAYFMKGDLVPAGQYYTQALEADPSYSAAYLNRANSLVKGGTPAGAVPDYETYLSLEPGAPQREQILKLIAFIKEESAAAERRRVMAEEAARAEAERRKRLLEEVTESLQAAADDGKGLSAGSEDVQDYDGEFELE